MKLKNSRSVFTLFAAMVISSVVIGSYFTSKFIPLSDANAKTSVTEVSKYAEVDIEMELVKVGEHSWYVQGQAGIATDNASQMLVSLLLMLA